MRINRVSSIIMLLLMLCGCSRRGGDILTELFTLSLGFDEKNIGMRPDEHNLIDYGIDVIHRNSFFYVTDKINEKVMKITEKGELLLVVYNQDTNGDFGGTDISTDYRDDTNLVSTKVLKPYKLILPEKIECDSDRNFYVVDNNQEYKKVNDDKTICDQLIVKFDNNGNSLYKIGKNGVGDVPFGFISRIAVDNHDNLIVIESDDNGWAVYKFGKDGTFINKVVIRNSVTPKLKSEENYLSDIVSVTPSRFDDEVYVTVQYIRENVESHLISRYETVYEKIFKYTLGSEQFSSMIMTVSPKYADMSKYGAEVKDMYSDPKHVIMPLDEFVGSDISHNLYFIGRGVPINGVNNNNYSLTVYSPDGHEIFNKNVKYPMGIVYTSPLIVSDDGRVFSYYIRDSQIVFVQVR